MPSTTTRDQPNPAKDTSPVSPAAQEPRHCRTPANLLSEASPPSLSTLPVSTKSTMAQVLDQLSSAASAASAAVDRDVQISQDAKLQVGELSSEVGVLRWWRLGVRSVEGAAGGTVGAVGVCCWTKAPEGRAASSSLEALAQRVTTLSTSTRPRTDDAGTEAHLWYWATVYSAAAVRAFPRSLLALRGASRAQPTTRASSVSSAKRSSLPQSMRTRSSRALLPFTPPLCALLTPMHLRQQGPCSAH